MIDEDEMGVTVAILICCVSTDKSVNNSTELQDNNINTERSYTGAFH